MIHAKPKNDKNATYNNFYVTYSYFFDIDNINKEENNYKQSDADQKTLDRFGGIISYLRMV